MRIALGIISVVLLLVFIALSISLAHDKTALQTRLEQVVAAKNIEIDRLDARLQTQTAKTDALAKDNLVQKAELKKLTAALENANIKLETSAAKSREQAEEIENNRKLIATVEKQLKTAETALAAAQKAVEKEATAETTNEFELNQEVYAKRFHSISTRLNKNIDIAKKKNPPDRSKKSGGLGSFASTASNSSPAHIKAAEKILQELEAENKPSQKLYAAVVAEKQRWANDKTRREYLSKCAIQLRKDLEQFSAPNKTYLDD